MKKLILFNLMFYILAFALTSAVAETKQPVVKKSLSKKEAFKKFSNLTVKKEKLKGEGITFNFPNAKLDIFARFIAELSGKVLIGEELLKGDVNIKSEGKLDFEEVKSLFDALLYSKGLDVVEDDLYMEIVQRSDSHVKVYKLNYLKSADLAKSLKQMFRMSFRVGSNPQNIQITSIDDANALMVLAPKNQQMEIGKTIKKMDVRTRQVLLNIMVIELTKTSRFGFGVDFNFNDSTHNIGISSGGTSKTSPVKLPTNMTFTTAGTSSAGGFIYNNGNWFINVQGVDEDTIVKTLSQPRILTANNQKAEIKIGKKEPFVTSTSSLGSGTPPVAGNASTTSSVSTEDIGTDIEITPRINNLDDVTLEIKLKITNIVSYLQVVNGTTNTGTVKVPVYTASSNDVPQVGHRIINNTSNVMNGEVLVIGGLLKTQKTTIKTAPPILGDIPLIGWVFAKESEVFEQTELMVFISPSVINKPEETRTVTKNETNKFRNYDYKETVQIDNMLARKKSLTDDIFNMFDYFTNGKYRSEQDFIPQPGRL